MSDITTAIVTVHQKLLKLHRALQDPGDSKTEDELLELREQRKDMIEHFKTLVEVERLTTGAPRVSAAAAANSNRVPKNLPFIQWESFVRDDREYVYQDVHDALARFEVVLKAYNMDLNSEWERLLPVCLPRDLGDWLSEFYEANDGLSVPWSVCPMVCCQEGDAGLLR